MFQSQVSRRTEDDLRAALACEVERSPERLLERRPKCQRSALYALYAKAMARAYQRRDLWFGCVPISGWRAQRAGSSEDPLYGETFADLRKRNLKRYLTRQTNGLMPMRAFGSSASLANEGPLPYTANALLTLMPLAEGEESMDDEERESLDQSARLLYGLIHARFVVTSRGLAKMVRPVLWTRPHISRSFPT